MLNIIRTLVASILVFIGLSPVMVSAENNYQIGTSASVGVPATDAASTAATTTSAKKNGKHRKATQDRIFRPGGTSNLEIRRSIIDYRNRVNPPHIRTRSQSPARIRSNIMKSGTKERRADETKFYGNWNF